MIARRSKKRAESLPQLIKVADKLFSDIRRRESADFTGMVRCFVCGFKMHWKQADAAHCFHRDNMGTRYDSDNIRACCPNCNRFDPDHDSKIQQAVKNRMGDVSFAILQQRSRQLVKFTRHEMEEMIEGFKEKLKKVSAG